MPFDKLSQTLVLDREKFGHVARIGQEVSPLVGYRDYFFHNIRLIVFGKLASQISSVNKPMIQYEIKF